LNKNEHAILIRFSDNGVGIDESASEKIFLPHFSTKQSGSGLGLAIARQGMQQMGGRIFFESTLGIGSTFFIELPAIPDNENNQH